MRCPLKQIPGHVILVLGFRHDLRQLRQLPGCSIHASFWRMGLLKGNTQGGDWQLKAVTVREVRAVPDALQHGAHQQAASNTSDAEQPQRAQSAHAAAPCASRLHLETAAQHKRQVKALATIARVSGLRTALFGVVSCASQLDNSLHGMCSKTTLQSLERSRPGPEFASNAEAPPGNALKRPLSLVDLVSKRKIVKQPLSGFGRSLPFSVSTSTSAESKGQERAPMHPPEGCADEGAASCGCSRLLEQL